ncbi:MAG: hypothetical protein HUJ31_13270, partial [Pseudomonadales bacterium]|nr:hypothetical protein [Pseudomonadales bacterium]
PVAWLNAPWYALALLQTGEEDAAHRLLDRHLAGVIGAETDLSPPQRNLYLAANYAVRQRDRDAIAALEQVAANGYPLSWGILGTLAPLEDIRLFDRLPQDSRFSRVVRMMSHTSMPG